MRRPTLRFLCVFGLTALLAFGIEVLPWVDGHLIAPVLNGLAESAAVLIRLFGGVAESEQNLLRQPMSQFAIRISNGCSGVEAVILLVAAVAAYPSSWRQKWLGWGLGLCAIMALNMLRIISLFYIGQYSSAWFDWAHLYAWELLIMLDGVLVYSLWLRWQPRRSVEAL